MRWIRARTLLGFLGAALLLSCTLLLCVVDLERQLTVYTPQKTYAIEVQERQGHLYISLMDLLEPLGTANLHPNGKDWKLNFNNVDAFFRDGSDEAKVRGKSINLGSKVLAENSRLLVPLGASFSLLNALLRVPVELHPEARRLFLDNAATRFTAELKKSERPSLLLSFDHPVSPAIAQEENKIRLTFKREPVVSDITNQPWDDKSIQSLSFSENNGAAFLTVSGGQGLSASLAADGRTVIIHVLPPPVAAAPPPPPPVLAQEPSPPAVTAEPAATQPSTASPPRSAPAFFVMIDAGHGGDDDGARLGDKLAEKDVTLALARKIKSELQERGIAARLVRDTDVTVGLEQRAEITNQQRAAIYVAIHAGMPGHGVRVYAPGFSSELPTPSVKFLTWDNAQAAHLARSRTLARVIAGELGKKNVTVSTLNTP